MFNVGSPLLRRVIQVCLAIVAGAASVQASSTLYFPRLSFDPSTFTAFAIVNPTDQDAIVTLTAYGRAGLPVTGIRNPVLIPVPAHQQASFLTSEVFLGDLPDSESVAWFRADSPTDGLTGFFLVLNGAVTEFDGADLPQASPGVVFNQVRVGGRYSTELNLINPGPEAAPLELRLIGAGVVSKTLELPALGAARLDVGSFFGVAQTAPGAYVNVVSEVPVAGFELVHTGEDVLGLNASPASDQLTYLYFPQVAVLGPWKTELGLVNYSDQPVIATLTVFQADGKLFASPDLLNNPVAVGLDPGESRLEDVAGLFGFFGDLPLDGWLKVESNTEAVNGFLTYGLPDSGSVASVPGSVEGFRRAVFSHIATQDGFFTGLGILNSGQLAANVRVVALTREGEPLGSYDTVLPPGSRLSRLIDSLIPQASGQNGGLIWVKSDLPLHLSSIFGSDSVLATIPPQPTPSDYNPDGSLSVFQLEPPLAIVQPDRTQPFHVRGMEGAPTWSVNGVVGGNEFVGTIDAQGLFLAPKAVPDPQILTITVESGGQVAGASVDVIRPESLWKSPNLVKSVVYMESLKNLYTAELAVLSSVASGSMPRSVLPAAESLSTDVVQTTPEGFQTTLAEFPNQEISKMVSFVASNGREYLLMAVKTSGRVVRMDPLIPEDRQEVASGLERPTALVIDGVTGDLLVAEASQVTRIPRGQLEVGLGPALQLSASASRVVMDSGSEASTATRIQQAGEAPPGSSPLPPVIEGGADGIAVDRCTGHLYVSRSGEGTVFEFIPRTGELLPVVSGLNQPTQLLAIYRDGVSCPDSFQLLAVEKGENRIVLILIREGSFTPWVEAAGGNDLAYLPPQNPFADTESVLVTVGRSDDPRIPPGLVRVAVSRIYKDKPENPSRSNGQAEGRGNHNGNQGKGNGGGNSGGGNGGGNSGGGNGGGNPDPGNPDRGNPDPGNPDRGNPDPGNPDRGNPDPGNPGRGNDNSGGGQRQDQKPF